MTSCITRVIIALLLSLVSLQAHAANSVYIEDMTWMEVRDRMNAGASTVIIPAGGIEQNGPHMVIGKHNTIVRFTGGEIAKRLGNALVAPVIAYVPEGRIEPPEGHMQFPGTVSVSPEAFSMVLEDAARSMKQHGFRVIVFIGDHGGTQEMQKNVAAKLNSQWQSSGVRVIHASDYYSTENGQDKWVQSVGIKVTNPSAHAGFADTSELMAIDAPGVYNDKLGARAERDFRTTGAMGDSTKASAVHGRRLLSLKIEAAVAQIQNAIARGR